MTNPAATSLPQALKQIRVILGIGAVGMFIAFIACWLLDVEPMLTLAIGVLALADAAGFALLTIRERRAPAASDSSGS